MSLDHTPEQLKNVANNIIWADSSVFRYPSADKWKYGILVNAGEKKESCFAQDKTALG
jgi:hypothetical protein